MKKYAAIAMALASLCGMATPAQSSRGGQTVRNEAVKDIKPPVRKHFAREVNNSGAYIDTSPGLSPKEYGQYLQCNGLQKWTKKIRK